MGGEGRTMRVRVLAMLALSLLPPAAAAPAHAEPVTPRHPAGLRHAYAWARRARREPRQTDQGALRRHSRARSEAARRRHQAARDSRQGLGRHRRCRLRDRELLVGQAPRRFAVRGLPLRPRRQDLSRLVRAGQRPEALSGDVRPRRARRSMSCRAPSAAPRPAAGSPRRSRPPGTSTACACASSGSAAG